MKYSRFKRHGLRSSCTLEKSSKMATESPRFPILYFNLAGELVYIIEQRLEAQNVARDKSAKVLNDILSAMLNRDLITECFQARNNGTLNAMKALVEKLAHSSMMRLAQDSLDKLFELMLMAVKYQITTVAEPRALYDVTWTHIESWHRMTDDPEITLMIQHAHGLLSTHYKKLSPWSWMVLRHTMLNYLQRCKTRVTVFLKKELQSQLGYFRLELTRPLPEHTVLPCLVGKWRPYHFECNNTDAVHLGSNMFNETRRSLNPRHGAIASLDKILVDPPKSKSEPEDTSPPAVPQKSLEWDSLQIQLQAAPVVARDPKPNQVSAEETLLDLFDQAALSN